MKKNTITRFINKIKKNKFAIIIIFSILIIFLIDNFFKKEENLKETLSTNEIIKNKSQSLGADYSNTFTNATN